MIALTVELLKHFIGSLDNSDGRAGRCDESHFLKVPVLRQVFAESIGVKEHTHNGSNRTLLAQFLSTSGSIVRHMGTESVEVCYHAVEGSAGTDALLLSHFLIGNTVLAVEFSPSTIDDDIIEGGFYPCLVMLGKVVGGLHAKGFKTCCIASAYAPNFIDGI